MSTREAKEILEIPAKPAAVTAANVAVLTGLAVAATGPVGAAVAAAVAGVTTAAVKGKGKATAKAAMRAASPSGSRRSAGASSRGNSGGGRTRSGLLSRLTGGRRTGAGGIGAKATGAKGSAAGKPGFSSSGRTSPLRKLANAVTPKSRRASSLGASRPASSGGPSRKLSAPRRAANKVIGATWPKMKKAVKSAVTAGSSSQKGKQRPTGKWKKARDFFQSRILGRKKKEESAKKAEENVGGTVASRNRPASSVTAMKNGRAIVVRRAGKPVPLGTPSTAQTTGGKAMAGSMKHHASQMWVYAGSFEPRNFMEIVDEIHELPDVVAYMAGAIGALLAKGQRKWPADEAVKAELGNLVAVLHDAASIAKKLPGLMEEVHAEDLKRFRQPRQGEHLMNVSA